MLFNQCGLAIQQQGRWRARASIMKWERLCVDFNPNAFFK